jgi:hypothetical protein
MLVLSGSSNFSARFPRLGIEKLDNFGLFSEKEGPAIMVSGRADVAAAAVLLVSLAIAGCSGARPVNLKSTVINPAPEASRHQIDLDSTHADRALRAAGARAAAAINVPGEIIGISGGLANPRSSLGSPITTDGGVRVRPGRYLLAFACVGSGQVLASIWVRNAHAEVRAICHRQPIPLRLDLTAHRGGPVFVQFAATRHETVAIAGWAASR